MMAEYGVFVVVNGNEACDFQERGCDSLWERMGCRMLHAQLTPTKESPPKLQFPTNDRPFLWQQPTSFVLTVKVQYKGVQEMQLARTWHCSKWSRNMQGIVK
jgi:hypothetical protein